MPQVEVLNLVPRPSIMPMRFFMASSMPPPALASTRMVDALFRAMPRPRKVPSKPRINRIPGMYSAIRSPGLATAALISCSEPCSTSRSSWPPPFHRLAQVCSRAPRFNATTVSSESTPISPANNSCSGSAEGSRNVRIS
ncbi:hypothetical protein D3C77_580520 [compost metagenome]